MRDSAALLDFSRLDWLVAWRHLRTGDARPGWVFPLILAAIYLMVVGGAMALYATTLDAGAGPIVIGPFDVPGTDDGPTPLQRFYGAFGGLTLIVGVMFLTFGLLSWFFNLLPTIITMSVLLGCMALVVVLSLMSGLEGDLRDKILNQKAHVRVARADGRPFEDYMALADALAGGGGIAGASPYLEGEIMVRSGLNRQGAILAGIIPARQTTVSNLPDLVREGDYDYLTHPEKIPDPDPFADVNGEDTPWRLRHLEEQREKDKRKEGRSFEAQAKKVGDVILPFDDESGDGAAAAEAEQADQQDADVQDVQDEEDDDGEWEDPAITLGLAIPTAEEEPGERGGLLNRLPRPGIIKTVPGDPVVDDAASAEAGGEGEDEDEDEDEDEGWEDPEEEIDRLRRDGVLPAAPAGEDEDDGDSDDGDDAAWDPEDGVSIQSGGPTENIYPLLIGRELSAELGVGEGAQVQLITPIGRMTPAGRIPGQLVTKVAGVFFSGMYEYDRKNVYAPLPVVQRFLLVGDRVTGIEIKLSKVENIDAGKAEVERIVAAAGRGSELLVEDWRDLNRNLFSAMFLEKVAMFIALLFVVLVASFGILASNLMSVMEKAKEIAILKAMGTADAGIMRIFIAEGLCMGLLGSFGGIAMGLGLCAALDRFGLPLNENVYYIEKLPVVVNPAEVALVGIAALVIVCFSSLYPALVASRLRPVEGLRHAD